MIIVERVRNCLMTPFEQLSITDDTNIGLLPTNYLKNDF